MARPKKGVDTIKDLFIKYRNGNTEVFDIIFSRYLPYVEKIVEEYKGLGLEDEDLTQSAYEGLLTAISTFNEDTSSPFVTQARYNIEKCVLQALTDTFGMNYWESNKNIGLDNIRILNKIKEIEIQFIQYYGKKPSLKELRKELGISYDRLQEVLMDASLIELVDARFPDSITESEEELEDISFPDSITVPTQTLRPVELGVITGEIKEQLLQEFENLNLSPTRIEILKLRSLMRDSYTLSECEKMLHISRSRVQQLEHNALYKLKNDTRISLKGYINELEEYKEVESPQYRLKQRN